MKFYTEDTEKVFATLSSNENGLAEEEAERRINEQGKNVLAEAPKKPFYKRILAQFADPMTLILLAAAGISFIMSVAKGESFADVIIILFVVILNAVLGILQENKAEKAIDALKEMTKAKCKVIRGGKTVLINSEDVCVGDVIIIEAGDAIPADGRITEAFSLKTEESALTGESLPIEKTADTIKSESGDIPLGDRKNTVYAGTTAVYGKGKVIVTATGAETEMGKIAKAITDAAEEKTPLQKKLSQLGKILTYAVIAICVIIFGVKLFTAESINGDVLIDTFMVAVSLAVAAIPEGLSAVVTIVLSMGVSKMAARNAIVRKLTCVETLGCTQVICTDKTGTLTQNRMRVVKTFTGSESILYTCNALCNDCEITGGKATGEPTEAAMCENAYENGYKKDIILKEQPIIAELPFDSERKMMSTLHSLGGKVVQYTKGAPDIIISRCNRYISPIDGKIKDFGEGTKEAILAHNKSFADEALRVLASAFTVYDTIPNDISSESNEKNMIFIGLCGMADPIRDEVFGAVNKCRAAGIRPIMITGDHIDTAVAIGKQLGIIKSRNEALSGEEIEKISDEELTRDIAKYSVYARVQPEHKSRIVSAWRSAGYITAMTGDGVNDAPSIKSADIGIGMGITGTDVTKGVADMILADDNFATIVDAAEEGRRIYDNIQKTIQFLLSSNLAEVLGIFITSLFGFTLLKPAHLLWINLITDSIPALGLGTEKAEEGIMERKPRSGDEGLFSNGMGKSVIIQGAAIALMTVISFFIGNTKGAGIGTAMAFVTMSMAEIFHSFNMRSRKKSIFALKEQNIILVFAFALSFVLTSAVIFIKPLRNAFSFAEISFIQYALAVLIGALIIPICEAIKYFNKKA